MTAEPPWLAEPLRRLEGLAQRLPHAILIQGPGGWGEERLANALATSLLGLPPEREAKEVAHPDLRWLAPEDDVIKVGAIRLLIDFLMQTPQLTPRKVAVVESAERMNPNAANALLKTLEEPPPESFVALATGAPERLPATVASRCQRIAIRRAPPADVLAWLNAAGADPERAGYLAVEYGGAPFATLEALQRDQPPLWRDLARAGQNAAEIRDIAQARRDDNLADLARRWLRIVHRLLRQMPPAEVEPVLEFATQLADLRRMAMLNTGLNRPMQLQRMLLRWAEIWPRLPKHAPSGSAGVSPA